MLQPNDPNVEQEGEANPSKTLFPTNQNGTQTTTVALVVSILGFILSPLLFLGLPLSVAALILGIITKRKQARLANRIIIIATISLFACMVVGVPFTRGFLNQIFTGSTPAKQSFDGQNNTTKDAEDSSKSLDSKLYANSGNSISFNPPKGWEKQDGQPPVEVIFKEPIHKPDQKDNFTANINLTSDNIDDLLAENDDSRGQESYIPIYNTYVKRALETSARQLEDFKNMKSEPIVLAGHAEESYMLESTYILQGTKLHNLQLFDIKENKMYIFTATASHDIWGSYAEVFNQSLRTVK